MPGHVLMPKILGSSFSAKISFVPKPPFWDPRYISVKLQMYLLFQDSFLNSYDFIPKILPQVNPHLTPLPRLWGFMSGAQWPSLQRHPLDRAPPMAWLLGPGALGTLGAKGDIVVIINTDLSGSISFSPEFPKVFVWTLLFELSTIISTQMAPKSA